MELRTTETHRRRGPPIKGFGCRMRGICITSTDIFEDMCWALINFKSTPVYSVWSKSVNQKLAPANFCSLTSLNWWKPFDLRHSSWITLGRRSSRSQAIFPAQFTGQHSATTRSQLICVLIQFRHDFFCWVHLNLYQKSQYLMLDWSNQADFWDIRSVRILVTSCQFGFPSKETIFKKFQLYWKKIKCFP